MNLVFCKKKKKKTSGRFTAVHWFSNHIGLWYKELPVTPPAWNVSISVLRPPHRWYTLEHSSSFLSSVFQQLILTQVCPLHSFTSVRQRLQRNGCILPPMHWRMSVWQQQQQQHCCVFVVSCAGTSEPVRDGDICIFKFFYSHNVLLSVHGRTRGGARSPSCVASRGAMIVAWDCEIKMNQ